jgi:2-methylcitrate dehydratase PrpD
MSVARQLAVFLTRVTYEDLPPLAIERAKMLIASTLASAAVGTQIESASIIKRLAVQRGGTAEASLWFDDTMLPVADAARSNAMLSDAAASDDSDLRTIAHIGTIATSTAFALAERTGASGKDVLSAIVAGYECAGRMNDAIRPGALGFHGTTIAIFSGAVIGARLLNLDEEAAEHAITITSTSTGGGLAISTNTIAREYHAGNSAMLSLNAVMAAGAGYRVDPELLEAAGGFVQTFGGPAGADVLVHDLGVEWDITTDMALKLMPGAHPYHSIAEAAAQAAIAGDVKPQDVERILVTDNPFPGMASKLHPGDLADAIHSLIYFVSAAVVDRRFGWEHVSAEKLADPVIRELQTLVQPDPLHRAPGMAWKWAGTVTIVLKDGRRFEASVDAPRGSGPRGIDWDDVDHKYRTLVPTSGMSSTQVERSLEMIKQFESSAVPDLLALLRPGSATQTPQTNS